MTSSEIWDLIFNIKAARGKEKIAILQKHDCPELRTVLNYAMNPYITYGLTWAGVLNAVVDVYPNPVGRDLEPSDLLFLDELAGRIVTGNAAAEGLAAICNTLNHNSANLLTAILDKNLDCGLGVKSINKAIPGLIPTFDPMAAEAFDETRIERYPVYIEPKFDGYRVLAIADKDDKVRLLSKEGNEFYAYEHLKEPLAELRRSFLQCYFYSEENSLVFDGEILSGTFKETSSSARKLNEQDTQAYIVLFDFCLGDYFFGETDTFETVLSARRRVLSGALQKTSYLFPQHSGHLRLSPQYLVNSKEEIDYYYEKFRSQKLEGAMVKIPDSLYQKKRCYDWMKMKNWSSEEFEVIDAEIGTRKNKGRLGALIVDVDGVKVKVGGGYTDYAREDIWKAYLDDKANGTREVIGRIIEVKFQERTEDGSLRHPTFLRFRDPITTGAIV